MESDNIAPVAFFIFNRPALTARVFECIRAARPRKLLVVADGPRPTRPDDAQLCEATRKIVESPDWPCELITSFADGNLGCRRRLSSGLNWVFDQCPEAIVLEDDCVPCRSFFSFCSTMLSRYRDDARIMHVSGTISGMRCGGEKGVTTFPGIPSVGGGRAGGGHGGTMT